MSHDQFLVYSLTFSVLCFILLNLMSRGQEGSEQPFDATIFNITLEKDCHINSSTTSNFTESATVPLSTHLRSRHFQLPPKIILFWTEYFRGPHLYMGKEGERLKECPVSNCLLTDNKSLVDESAALFFHPMDINLQDIPLKRQPHQLYIYFVLESPPHTAKVELPNFFNLTFTYRLDSDIIADNYLQYFKPRLLYKPVDFEEILRKKSKNRAAAMISNCYISSSYRMQYITELNNHFPVDLYGDCGDGNFICSKTNESECDSILSSYKFYLAFENSICHDYVTEKIIRAYNADTIPIVLGAANYSAFFPRSSFINVMNFHDPRELGGLLHYLSTHKEAYAQYFRWRLEPDLVKLPPFLHPGNVSLCKLCELLNSEIPPPSKFYPNINEWWSYRDCQDLDLSKLQDDEPPPPIIIMPAKK